ncbi:AI-2E family transporter [Mucilaginibacter litoreus]|uniref:AI-2E family transporter n=1 Tax=Mucilaginibacter litoreus TaxID=1048221 RepID=A0ABW3AWY2_9SPHI
MKNFATLPFYVKLACVLFSLMSIGYLAIQAKEILSPLIFSCLFAILLLPLAAFFEKKLKFPRSFAAMTAVILLLLAIGGMLYILATQLTDLASDWPQFQQQLGKEIDSFQNWITVRFHVNEARQLKYVRSAATDILSSGTAVVGATVLSLSSILLFLVFTFIYTFFFLFYRRLIMRFLESVFLDENKMMVHQIIEQVQYVIHKYIVGLLIEMAIVTTFVSMVLSLMGVKYALFLGLVTGIFNLVPYVGIFTSLLLSTFITFATAASGTKVLLVVITYLITHLTDSNILLPLIVGSKVRINALVTVLGVVIGEMLWGIPGMFLSIPVIAVLKIIFDHVATLKPWGIILGDEDIKQNRLATRLMMNKRKSHRT